jgi:methylenetetrahydrofolate reductase (NADPH)
MAAVKLTELMKEKQLLSFEVFPPKTEKGMENLPGTLEHLCEFEPDYISCTYGAGGGNVGANREVCQMIKKAGTTPVTHFTVIKNTREGMKEQLDEYLAGGVDHVLALRGDIPRGETTTCGDFDYATDLVSFIRKEYGDKFEIAVAGSPEGHIACRSLDADISVLKMKQDNGADYIMTQLCWDMEQFKRWLDKIRTAGVTMPVDVGIMPILDQAATINMALSRNGCVMERELSRLISKYWIFPNPFDKDPFDDALEQKKKDFKEAGIEYTIKQIDAYRACGIEGIHLYALNKWQDVSRIIKESGMKTLI